MPSIEQGPVKIDYERYFSLESKHRQRSQLKELRPYFEIPGMISVSARYNVYAELLSSVLGSLTRQHFPSMV